MEIEVRAAEGKWGAFFNDKLIATSSCRPCVVKAVISVTRRSSKYKTIKVFNQDGSVHAILQTGEGYGRPVTKGL